MIPSLRRTASACVLLLAAVFATGCDSATEPTTPSGLNASESTQTPTQPPATTATETSAVPVTPIGSSSATASESPDGDSQPATYREGLAVIAALEQSGLTPQSLKRFVTPGDAVYCVLKSPYLPASCELGTGSVTAPDVCGQAPTDQVGRIELGNRGAQPQCNTDTIREPGAKVIESPALVSLGAVSCAVEERGVTCVDSSTRSGFFLTPGAYGILG